MGQSSTGYLFKVLWSITIAISVELSINLDAVKITDDSPFMGH